MPSIFCIFVVLFRSPDVLDPEIPLATTTAPENDVEDVRQLNRSNRAARGRRRWIMDDIALRGSHRYLRTRPHEYNQTHACGRGGFEGASYSRPRAVQCASLDNCPWTSGPSKGSRNQPRTYKQSSKGKAARGSRYRKTQSARAHRSREPSRAYFECVLTCLPARM